MGSNKKLSHFGDNLLIIHTLILSFIISLMPLLDNNAHTISDQIDLIITYLTDTQTHQISSSERSCGNPTHELCLSTPQDSKH